MKIATKKMFVVGFLLGALALSAETTFKITADHPKCLYACGETAEFTVTAVAKSGKEEIPVKSGMVEATLDNFGTTVFTKAAIDLAKENPFKVKGSLSAPGFLRLRLGGKNCKGTTASVGFDPTRIVKGSPSPSDFDEFWKNAREKIRREIPLDAKMTLVPERSAKSFDYYRISFATYGRRVHGYMSVPKDKSKAPYPVEFQVSAAGFGGWTNNMGGKSDTICVFFSVYPFEPHWNWHRLGLKAKYDQMNEQMLRDWKTDRYCTAGITKSREDYFFYPVILGIDRAVDWVAARPDVDRKRFRYYGTSQGGGFGFYLTGLNHTFTRAAFYVPAITDTMGYLKGRQSGWPMIVESNSSSAELRAAAERNAPYFDGANFASRIQCPVRIAVGFSDNTCPACAVYASYNEIRVSDKGIVHGIGMTHSCFGRFYQELGAWLSSDR